MSWGCGQIIWALFLSLPPLAKSLLKPSSVFKVYVMGTVALNSKNGTRWEAGSGRPAAQKTPAELASSAPTITTRALSGGEMSQQPLPDSGEWGWDTGEGRVGLCSRILGLAEAAQEESRLSLPLLGTVVGQPSGLPGPPTMCWLPLLGAQLLERVWVRAKL